MKAAVLLAATALAIFAVEPADAKGCIKGAIVGAQPATMLVTMVSWVQPRDA